MNKILKKKIENIIIDQEFDDFNLHDYSIDKFQGKIILILINFMELISCYRCSWKLS
jgi:hypothetical protein